MELRDKLYLWRWRNGYTQYRAAEILRIDRNYYQDYEEGCAEMPPHVEATAETVENVTKQERCRVLRKRSLLTTEEIKKDTGIGRHLLLKMERGQAPAGRLFRYWGI